MWLWWWLRWSSHRSYSWYLDRSNLEICSVLFKLSNNLSLIAICAYRPPRGDVAYQTNLCNYIVDMADKHPNEIIFCHGDLNLPGKMDRLRLIDTPWNLWRCYKHVYRMWLFPNCRFCYTRSQYTGFVFHFSSITGATVHTTTWN